MTGVRRLLRTGTRYVVLGSFLLLAVLAAGLWYLRSESFQRKVRGRITAAIEHATGGRAELGRFHVTPFRLRVDVDQLTIHGRERGDELPLLHVDRLSATVNLSSVLGARIGFHSLTLERPVVHLVFYADGTTNQPAPERRTPASFEELFSLSIDKLAVKQGEFVCQDARWPLDFTLNELSAIVDYSYLHRAYSGHLAVGNAELHADGSRPVLLNGQTVFSVQRNQIDFSLLRVESEGSRLQASGTLSNFSKPLVKADYDLLLNLPQAASIFRQPGIRSGKLGVRGSGQWSRDDLRASGRFEVAGFSWRESSIRLDNASASGRFSLDSDHLRLFEVGGQLLAGSFSSEGEISGWPALLVTRKNGISGIVRLKAKDISVSGLRAGLGPHLGPFSNLRWQGNISGDSEIRWKNSLRNAQLKVTAAVSYPARLSPGEVPLKASSIASYDARTHQLDIQDLAASTPASELHAKGSLSPSGVVRFSFSTSHLEEWQPLITAFFPAGLPLTVNQRAMVNGTVSGGLPNLSIAATADIRDANIFLPKGASGARAPTHWDAVTADFRLSSRALLLANALLRNGATTVKLQGTAGLSQWRLFADSPLQLHGSITNGDPSQLAQMVHGDLPISGRLNSAFRLYGSWSN
ncbi:MAG: hypothetical protein JO159_20090, partial [Acidobacteria bacterium]|nr:hypothetical protein [Acidobacteriota bacterium]